MLNVNQLTEQLRMMPDQALQRMAQMYKNDPYILPMLISEDTARKKLRQAAQAQAAQPQPKVADQAIAAMGTPPMPAQAAPGIAALQAPNMERMADGGIAGYAEGGVADSSEDAFSRGGMFDFAQRSEPVIRMAAGGVPGYAGQTESLVRIPESPTEFYSSQLPPSSDPLTELHRQAYTFEADRLAAEKDMAAADAVLQRYGVRQRQADPEGFARAVAAKEEATKRRDLAAKRYTQESGRLVPKDESERAFKNPSALTADEAKIYSGLYATPPQAPMLPIPDVQIAGQKQTGAAPGAAPGAAAPARAPAVAQPSVEGAKQTAAQFLDQQAIERQAKEFEMGETTAVDEARRRRQKMRDERGEAYTGYEAAIKKEEEGAKGELEQSKAMAILNAGLAMMAGTSPRAFENIGKGAMVGTGQYAEAIKDFKKSAKERQRALADIEQARRAEARADDEAQEKAEERAADKLSNARKFGIDALMSAGVKNADIASKIYTTQVEQQGAMARTQMQDPLAVIRALSVPGPMRAGYEFMQQAKGEPMTKQKLFLEYMKNPLNDPAKFGEYVQQYERQFGPIGSSSGSASQSADEALVKKYLNPPR